MQEEFRVEIVREYGHAVKKMCLIVDCNFEITPDLILLMELRNGVEFIHKNTKYQFVVVVGKLFKPDSVELEIRDVIKNYAEA